MSRALVLFALLAVVATAGPDVRLLSAQSTFPWSLQGIMAHEAFPVAGFAWDAKADVGRFVEYTPAAETDDLATSPRDAASGTPTGKRQHKPFTITRAIDEASPILWQAVVDGTPLGDIEVWQDENGMRSHAFTLQNVMISSYSVSRGGGGGGGSAQEWEQVTFVYGKILLATEAGDLRARQEQNQ